MLKGLNKLTYYGKKGEYIKRGVYYMKWEEARNIYANKWILFEAIEAYSKEGKRIVEELSVINAYEEGKEALK